MTCVGPPYIMVVKLFSALEYISSVNVAIILLIDVHVYSNINRKPISNETPVASAGDRSYNIINVRHLRKVTGCHIKTQCNNTEHAHFAQKL